ANSPTLPPRRTRDRPRTAYLPPVLVGLVLRGTVPRCSGQSGTPRAIFRSSYSAAFIIVERIPDFAWDSKPAMNSSPMSPVSEPDPSPDARLLEMQAELQKLEHRDWWLWSMAVIVMLLLTFAVFTMSFPGFVKVDDPF